MEGSLLRLPIWRTALLFGSGAALLLLLAAAATLTAAEPTRFARYVPDGPAYTLHVALGTTLNSVGASASTAANQWVRAGAHARSDAELDTVVRGIVATRQGSGFDWQIDDQLCSAYSGGGESTREALRRAGADCSDDATVFTHVAADSPLQYSSRPPVGGQHYPTWYPDYGVVDDPVAPGYWVHNLEHGAVVLLYQCPNDCADTRAQLRTLYDGLPRSTSARVSAPRMLVTRYDDMDSQYAVVAWGHKLVLNSLDAAPIDAFYEKFVNRGPECGNGLCP
ncbi:MAG: hypothetical protein NVSMB2_05280 [Chloroflexota bacterium]